MRQFKEVQKFDQWYIWIPISIILLFWMYTFVMQIIFKLPQGTRPASDLEIYLIGLIPISILSFLSYLKLTTIISKDSISIHFRPFSSKQISLSDIVELKVLKYDFVGYGLRLSTKYGTVYNTKGNQGIAVNTRHGERFLIGTQKINELKQCLEESAIPFIDLTSQ
jgi:hypothetical protein